MNLSGPYFYCPHHNGNKSRLEAIGWISVLTESNDYNCILTGCRCPECLSLFIVQHKTCTQLPNNRKAIKNHIKDNLYPAPPGSEHFFSNIPNCLQKTNTKCNCPAHNWALYFNPKSNPLNVEQDRIIKY